MHILRRHLRAWLRRAPEDKIHFQRIARRAGVKRMSKLVEIEARACLRHFVAAVVHDAVKYMDYAHCKAVTVRDIKMALLRHGRPLFGFE